MHELSIAQALRDRVVAHLPPGRALRTVHVRAGALRGIDPQTMRWAWDSATADGPLAGSMLALTNDPWALACDRCGTQTAADSPDAPCPCGNPRPHVTATDDLELTSLDLAD